MKNFLVCIIFKIECEGVSTEQYEEQWRLFIADSAEFALQNARSTGKEEEEQFLDRHGRLVRWRFLAVKDIRETKLTNGELLVSQVNETKPAIGVPKSLEPATINLF